MRLLGSEHTKREATYLFLLLILLIGFLTINWAEQKTIKEYSEAYRECQANIEAYNSGYADVWGRTVEVTNGTIPK